MPSTFFTCKWRNRVWRRSFPESWLASQKAAEWLVRTDTEVLLKSLSRCYIFDLKVKRNCFVITLCFIYFFMYSRLGKGFNSPVYGRTPELSSGIMATLLSWVESIFYNNVGEPYSDGNISFHSKLNNVGWFISPTHCVNGRFKTALIYIKIGGVERSSRPR